MTFLDWRKHGAGALKPCRLCGQGALMRDQNGQPCHKTCAEREIDAKAAALGTRRKAAA